jgi:hypothetical protein
VSKKNRVVLASFFILRVTCVFTGEDATFDFTTDSLERLQDVQLRHDDNFFIDNLPLDAQYHRRYHSSGKDQGVFTSRDKHVAGVKRNMTPLNPPVVDPELLEEEVPVRDRAALKALEDDHVFFKKIVEKENITGAESYREALNDCQELLRKSAQGIQKADPVFYESVKEKLTSTQRKVMLLSEFPDTLQEEKIIDLQKDIAELQESVIERIGSFIFKNLILDALRLATRKLSHVKATLVKSQQGVSKKKKSHHHHKDSDFLIDESSYIDY